LPVRDKLWIVGLVLGLVAVWSAGFLWVRNDAGGDTAKAAARTSPTRSASPSASAEAAVSTPSISVSPNTFPSVTPVPPDQLAPIDINPDVARPRPQLLPPVTEFGVATFNVLGSSHTTAGGHSPGKASGPERINGVIQLLRSHNISVAGLQEFQPNQRRAFAARAGGWSAWPMQGREGENAVAWRTDTWKVLETHLVPIPYFRGRIRGMPYVLLQHNQTGLKMWFSSFHNPANVQGPAQQHRNEAARRQIRLFNRLHGSGYPQFATGDMNERQSYACKITRNTALVPAQGGSCPSARPFFIDWIFGSPNVQYSGYQHDRSPLVRRTSDHPFVRVNVRIDALDYPKAVSPTE
jgi:hypothetical protein